MNPAFTTVATFQYSSEAQIIKGRLRADGIDAFLADDVTIDTDPLVSQALGGVKLRVPTIQKDAAFEILESLEPFAVNNEGKRVQCPRCDADEVVLFTTVTDFKSFGAFLIGFLFGTLPFYTRYQYRCESCKTKFNLDA